jgi:hypothetical protein
MQTPGPRVFCNDSWLSVMDVMVACDEQMTQLDLGGGFLILMKEHGRESYIKRRLCITFLCR